MKEENMEEEVNVLKLRNGLEVYLDSNTNEAIIIDKGDRFLPITQDKLDYLLEKSYTSNRGRLDYIPTG